MARRQPAADIVAHRPCRLNLPDIVEIHMDAAVGVQPQHAALVETGCGGEVLHQQNPARPRQRPSGDCAGRWQGQRPSGPLHVGWALQDGVAAAERERRQHQAATAELPRMAHFRLPRTSGGGPLRIRPGYCRSVDVSSRTFSDAACMLRSIGASPDWSWLALALISRTVPSNVVMSFDIWPVSWLSRSVASAPFANSFFKSGSSASAESWPVSFLRSAVSPGKLDRVTA